MTGQNRRLFNRILFDAPCEIHLGDRIWTSQVLDISLQGALLREPESFAGQLGDEFDIVIQLGDAAASIWMAVTLRHREEQRLGFECRTLDLDSATHLRRLVELNLGDEAELHRELALLSES